ncbi:MAG: hypothetical protein J2P37_24080, partial [Ktedonobacteraceae bacterium]|nr:hypothetical protein [Ktedonobacteraceae bacterium]
CKHLELKPDYLRTAWMIEWCHLCFDPFDPAIVARLEKLAATEIHEYDENYELTYVCDSTTLLLRQRYEEALAALDPALALRPVGGDTAFWHGMALAALGRDQEAREALEFAREHGIPLSLFRTLKLLEQANPAFCAQYASEL